eukprot:10454261-Lingulodinium_polyedra.AAC.1
MNARPHSADSLTDKAPLKCKAPVRKPAECSQQVACTWTHVRIHKRLHARIAHAGTAASLE